MAQMSSVQGFPEGFSGAALPASALVRKVDPASLPFARSDRADWTHEPDGGVPLAASAVGQQRAVEAVRFALGMRGQGYNLFCMGAEGTGKASLARRCVGEAARVQPAAADWCYAYNFADPVRPRALRLPSGTAPAFARAMGQLVEDLKHALAAAFDGDDYRQRRQAITADFKARQESLVEQHREQALGREIAVMRTPMGLALAPMRNGEVLAPDDFSALPAEEQQAWRERMQALSQELEEAMRQVPRWEREQRQQMLALIREVADAAVRHVMEDLCSAAATETASVLCQALTCPPVEDYLNAVHRDVVDNVGLFLPDNEDGADSTASDSRASDPRASDAREGEAPSRRERIAAGLRRYQVNVLVTQAAADGSGAQGAPVIEEQHPTQPNLMGRIEHRQQMGALVTDFHLIRAGALHRANGGYLLLEARKLLTQPFAWEDLKRCLRTGMLRIEAPGSAWGVWSTQTLEPEPIPLSVKVILLGEPHVFYLLSEYDPDFNELFKAVAEFDTRMGWTAEHLREQALALARLGQEKDLRPMAADAVARVIEFGARLGEDSQKLSTHMGSLLDLMREADYLAVGHGAELVTAEHVEQALAARRRRSDRVPLALREEIERKTLHVATEGAEVGQINGLAVLQVGHLSFGKVSRLTARVRIGHGDVVHIERETEMSGPLHSKGVLILSSFLASRFAEEEPLPLHATLVFEQSYAMIDGDSASSTEVYVLMSALAEQPLRQDLAVTGSVDQFGRVQAIGGVNEKIEGFFDLCQARGLTGTQGVLIPATNIQHLMLREDVVAACAAGQFHIYPVETIDQGIALLTGVPAGELGDDGTWPVGTLNRMIATRLARWTRRNRDQDSAASGSRRRDRGG